MTRSELDGIIKSIEKFATDIDTDSPVKRTALYGRTICGILSALDSMVLGHPTVGNLDVAIGWLEAAKEVA